MNEDFGQVKMTENGIIEYIERIGDFNFDDLWELESSKVLAYHKL